MKLFKCFSFILLPALAAAQPLAALVDEALRNNREILAAQKKYEAARQRPGQANALPPPMLSVGYTANGAPYPVAGIGHDVTSNAGVMISQEMPFPGKQKLRGEIAAKEADGGFQDYLAVRRNVVSRLKQAYLALQHAAEGIAATTRDQELLQAVLRVSEARYATGGAAQQDIFKAQTQFAIFQAQLLRFQQDERSRRIEINALLNRPLGGAIEASAHLPPVRLPAALDDLLARAREDAPSLGSQQKNVERSQLAASLARRESYPDYTLSGGYFNQGSMPSMWQFRLDVKLPSRARHAAIAEQEFAAAEARHSYEGAAVELEARIRQDYTAAETAGRLADLYEKSVLPQARLAMESSLAGYQAGTVDFLSVLSNLMNVVDSEFLYHDEVMQFHVALARLEETTGGEWKK